jgi:WD40 repeat protein
MGRIRIIWAALIVAVAGHDSSTKNVSAAGDAPSAAQPERTPADASRVLRTTPLLYLPAHGGSVSDVAFSGDGRRFATVGRDLRVKICNSQTGRLVRELAVGEPSKLVNGSRVAVAFAPQGMRLAVAVGDEIQWFDAETGVLERRLAHAGVERFSRLRFTSNGTRLVSAGGKKLAIWSVPGGELLTSIDLFDFQGSEFALTPDGRYAATPDRDRSVALWDLQTGRLEHRFGGAHADNVRCTAVNHQGTLLAAADNRRIVLYDLQAKSERLRADADYPTDLAFSTDGLLAVGGDDIDLFLVGEKELVLVGKCRVRGEAAAGVVTFSPDGRRLATEQGFQDRADVFEIEWSQEERTVFKSSSSPLELTASPDGRLLARVDYNLLKLFTAADGKEVATVRLDYRSDSRRPLDFSPDGSRLLIRLSNGQCVRTFRVPNLEPERSWILEGCSDARFTPEGDVLLVGKNGTVIRQPATAEQPAAPAPIRVNVTQVRFAANGTRLIGAGTDRLEVYSWPQGKSLRSIIVGRPIDTLNVSPDGAYAVTTELESPQVRAWNLSTGEKLADFRAVSAPVFNADQGAIRAATFTSDSHYLLTSGDDGLLKVWSCEDWKLRGLCPISAAEADPRDVLLATVKGSTMFYVHSDIGRGSDGTVKEWNLAKLLERLEVPDPSEAEEQELPFDGGTPEFTFEAPDNWLVPAGLLDAGRAVYYVDLDDQLIVFDLATKKERFREKLANAGWFEFSPDERWFAASFPGEPDVAPGLVKIWDARTRKLHRTIVLETYEPEQFSFSPDAGTLAVASGNSGLLPGAELSLWDVASGRRTEAFPAGERRYTHVRFSPNGKLLASCDSGDTIEIWEVATKQRRHELKFRDGISDLRFSPDGVMLAVGQGSFNRGSVALFDVATGERRPILSDLKDEVDAITFSPSGDMLVVACGIEHIKSGCRFYRLPDGKEIKTLHLKDSIIGRGVIAFSPDGKHFAAGSAGRFRIWRVDQLKLETPR